jgi:hypothetical protein
MYDDLPNLSGVADGELQYLVLQTATALANGSTATISERVPNNVKAFEVEDIRCCAIVNATNGTATVGTVLPGPQDALGVTNTIPNLALLAGEFMHQSQSLQNGKQAPMTLLCGNGIASAGVWTRRTIKAGEDVSCKITNNTNLHATPVALNVTIVLVGRYK